MKRILSLDGGGIHGLFTLQVLREIERLVVAAYPEKEKPVLADHFHLIAGTSTGAIIASMLSWGARVDEVEAFYLGHARGIFAPAKWWRRFFYHRYTGDNITRFLQNHFREADGSPALLGSARLRTLLLVVLRNATKGSPWPLTNNPTSKYNRRDQGRDSNLDIPLWSLIRASTAAPTFFPPQRITVGSQTQGQVTYEFIDGGVSPYNNPAYLAYLVATLPPYEIRFPTGRDQLSVVSVGVGRHVVRYHDGEMQDMHVIGHARAVIRAMMEAASQQQDLLCRASGCCLQGETVDREIGALLNHDPAQARFNYVRYNHEYSEAEVAAALGGRGVWDLANLDLIPAIIAAGKVVAESQVKPEHLFLPTAAATHR